MAEIQCSDEREKFLKLSPYSTRFGRSSLVQALARFSDRKYALPASSNSMLPEYLGKYLDEDSLDSPIFVPSPYCPKYLTLVWLCLLPFSSFELDSYSSSWLLKGFAICSLPSRGLMRTRRVPRATMRPREREDSLPSSSAAEASLGVRVLKTVESEGRTHRVIIPSHRQAPGSSTDHIPSRSLSLRNISPDSTRSFSFNTPSKRTFSPSVELDANLLVHILGQIQYILLLRLFTSCLRLTTSVTSCGGASVAATSTASTTPTTSTSEIASLRHKETFFEGKRTVVELEEKLACGGRNWRAEQ